MEIEEIKKRVEQIERFKDDDEVAHSLEDNLFYEFVESIKNNNFKNLEEAIIASEELMKVREIEFGRWHA